MNSQKLQAHKISWANEDKLHYLSNKKLSEIKLQSATVTDSVMWRSAKMYRGARERSDPELASTRDTSNLFQFGIENFT